MARHARDQEKATSSVAETTGEASRRHRSFWLQQIEGDAPDAPPLLSDTTTDIAIVGGGYVGLWTAIRVKEAEPASDVVVVEQDICAGGASGRNGGFVLSWWPKLSSLSTLVGAAAIVQPAALARGLRRVALDMGVRIFAARRS